MSQAKRTIQLDRFGMAASLLCALHCAAVPIILSSAPLLGLSFLANERIESAMIIVALVTGATSLTVSYCKYHRRLTALIILISGFLIIAAGHFLASGDSESVIVPFGGLIIAVSHYINWRLTRRCLLCHRHK